MMRRALAILIAAAVLCVPAASDAFRILSSSSIDTGKQLFLTQANGVVSTLDRYLPLSGGNSNTTIFKASALPVPGAIKSLTFWTGTQPAAGKSWTATVYKNGSSTAASCSVTSAVAVCSWTGSIATSTGDDLVVFITTSGGPSNSTVSAVVGWTPTTANDTVIVAAPLGGTFSTGATNVIEPSGISTPATIGNTLRLSVLPDDGTIDNMCINAVAPGTGKSYAYTLLVNGSGSTLTKTLSDAATADCDATHSVSASAADYLNFQGVPSGTPTASDAAFGTRYLASTTGGYVFMASANAPSTSAARYYSLVGITNSATESDKQGISLSQTIVKLRAKVNVAPGTAASGKKWTVTLRKSTIGGAAADTAATCDIVETATTCSWSGSVAINDNDIVDVAVTPTSSPASTSIGWGLLATR